MTHQDANVFVCVLVCAKPPPISSHFSPNKRVPHKTKGEGRARRQEQFIDFLKRNVLVTEFSSISAQHTNNSRLNPFRHPHSPFKDSPNVVLTSGAQWGQACTPPRFPLSVSLTVQMLFLGSNHLLGGRFAHGFGQALSGQTVSCRQQSVVYCLSCHFRWLIQSLVAMCPSGWLEVAKGLVTLTHTHNYNLHKFTHTNQKANTFSGATTFVWSRCVQSQGGSTTPNYLTQGNCTFTASTTSSFVETHRNEGSEGGQCDSITGVSANHSSKTHGFPRKSNARRRRRNGRADYFFTSLPYVDIVGTLCVKDTESLFAVVADLCKDLLL